jgi:ribA/ribD-fused uncharacterized protein
VIDSFSGQYRFLSNFFPSPITIKGKVYATVEHAFQAAKLPDPAHQEMVRMACAPGYAKRLGRSYPRRDDWDEIKDGVTLETLRLKFQHHPALAQSLLMTGSARLVEGNTWGDRYWGVCDGVGKNRLGELLMQVREEIRQGRLL